MNYMVVTPKGTIRGFKTLGSAVERGVRLFEGLTGASIKTYYQEACKVADKALKSKNLDLETFVYPSNSTPALLANLHIYVLEDNVNP